jgi:hypothetical protein
MVYLGFRECPNCLFLQSHGVIDAPSAPACKYSENASCPTVVHRDGVSQSKDGGFWVAMPARRTGLIKFLRWVLIS